MHLKSCPKRLDPDSSWRSQHGELLKTCAGNYGNGSRRFPYAVISADALKPARQTAEDDDVPLDIWSVIKPGHVREKIAIFASEGGQTEAGGGGREGMMAPPLGLNHAAMTGPIRAVKAKGSWEENCSAKRRRWSGSNQNLRQDQGTPQQHRPSPRCSDSTQRAGGGRGGEVAAEDEDEEEHKVSVVEMVAFLEQRASEQQLDCKPLLAFQRSSTAITLSRAPPPEGGEGSEVRGEEPESVRVSDMVAKLESECLRRKEEGDLSRSNSLRRTVGRVLLAAGDQSSAPSHPTVTVTSSSPALLGAETMSREPIGCSESVRTTTPALTTPPSPAGAPPPHRLSGVEGGVTETLQPEEEEPPPGLLFLSPPTAASDSAPPPTDLQPRPSPHRTTFDPEPRPPAVGQSEKRKRRAAEGEEVACERRASQDFLLMRQRLQQLLEPQPFLAVLPHHLLLKILLLLPTQTLAALKCTCRYFKFVIENYGVRPADSLWVSDPRYRDDPCKQCKKRYGRGDVSLCRWHHKPYCQALPYGPGYWMCCHGARKDAPGCNVGLHDNRWVPAFHSINVPIYRKSHGGD